MHSSRHRSTHKKWIISTETDFFTTKLFKTLYSLMYNLFDFSWIRFNINKFNFILMMSPKEVALRGMFLLNYILLYRLHHPVINI